MSLTLRYMTLRDIGQVVEIDRAAFPAPWSARSYAYEVGESAYSHMVVLERASPAERAGWRRVVAWLNRGNGVPHTQQLVAYGGLWRIMDEAHISTIATHPAARGAGFGELVLAGMIRRAITLAAGYIVLEVRVSNTVAQNLYAKYGFEVVDTKRGYYHDNHEDAYDMRLSLTDSSVIERFNRRYVELSRQYNFFDGYTETRRPPVM